MIQTVNSRQAISASPELQKFRQKAKIIFKREMIDVEAEKSLLGAVMIDGHNLSLAAEHIDSHEDFSTFPNQCIWRAIIGLESEGKPYTPTAIADWLRGKNLIDDVKYDYLGEVYQQASLSPGHDAKIIREKSLLRRLSRACTETQEDVLHQPEEVSAIVERAEQRFFDLATLRAKKKAVPMSQLVSEAGDRMDERKKSKVRPGLSLGWGNIDSIIKLRPTQVTIVAARTSVGKSVFAGEVARSLLKNKHYTLFASLEMSNEELTDRLMCAEAGVNSVAFDMGALSSQDVENLQNAYEVLGSEYLRINDDPSQTMLQIASEARRMKAQRKLDCIIVDYLQIVNAEVRRKDRREEVDEISRRLKGLAKQLKVPILALAQINREAANEEPQLHNLRESGALEQDADNVIILHKPSPNDDAEEDMVVKVAKQRGGPKKKATLIHNKATFRLYEKPPVWRHS